MSFLFFFFFNTFKLWKVFFNILPVDKAHDALIGSKALINFNYVVHSWWDIAEYARQLTMQSVVCIFFIPIAKGIGIAYINVLAKCVSFYIHFSHTLPFLPNIFTHKANSVFQLFCWYPHKFHLSFCCGFDSNMT